MRNRKMTVGMTAAVMAGFIALASVYGAAIGAQIHTDPERLETETEETELETEAVLEWLDVLFDSKNAAMATDSGMMMEACEEDGYYAWSEPVVLNWNTEEYNTVEETGFRLVKQYPFSTFGMDVDTASYALLRRNILDDTMEWMPEDGIRIEEMINYFNYDYEMPQEDDTFSITAQIAPCPWNPDTKLLLVGLQAKDIPQEEIPDQNLVLLVDTSGSMYDENKLPLAVSALKLMLKDMDENDAISLVTYAGSSEVLLEGVRCTPEGKEKITAALDSLEANGGTYGETGLRTAYELAQASYSEGANNRVLLLTDGDFNLGQTDDSELVKLVQEKAEGKIFLSILGFGSGNYNDVLAEELADKGNGNYSYIDSDMEARRVMGGALKGTLNTVAKDAKIQIDFNPAQIKGYRQIGYENRQMDAEDFEDDTKDGGEVGAGQQVTALYELVMADSDFEIRSAQSKYTQTETAPETGKADASDSAKDQKVSLTIAGETEAADAGTADTAGSLADEYLTVSIRYKDPDAEESRLQELIVDASAELEEMSDNMSWAGGVAQAGMLLRGSEFAGDSDYTAVRSRLRELTGGDEFREEFIYLLGRVANMG